MRFVTTLAALVVLSTLTGCATSSEVSRRGDTAVRAEARRISDARHYADNFRDGPGVGPKAPQTL